MSDSNPVNPHLADRSADLLTLFKSAVAGRYGVRIEFDAKERASAAAELLEPSYALHGQNGSIHLVYLVAATEGERLRILVDELQDGDVVFDVVQPDGNDFKLMEEYGEHVVGGGAFGIVTVDEIEEKLFPPVETVLDADRVMTSIEDAYAAGVKFFDATVTGELVPGVLDHPYVGSVLRSHKDWQATNVFSDVRGLYRHVAEHVESDQKEGFGITACHLAKDKETGKERRKKRNVESNGAFMFDFDGEQLTDEILGIFEGLGVTFASYSSYNHLKTPGVHKSRVVLPFESPFIPDEYGDRENRAAAVWRASFEAFCERHGLAADGNAKDMTRFMNSPRHPKGGTFFSRIQLGPLHKMEVVLPEERPIAKRAKKAGVTLAYHDNGEAYVAEGNGVEFFLSLIGDDDGQLGFHNPIYRVLCSYFSQSNEGPKADAAPIVRRLRETIQKAVKGPGRAQADIDRYMSDDYLSAEIENARAFIRERIETRKAEEKAEKEHMDALVTDYRKEPDPEKLEEICKELVEIGRPSLIAYCRDGLAKKETGKTEVSRGAFDAVMKPFAGAAKKKQAAARKRSLVIAARKPLIMLSENGFAEQCSIVAEGIDTRNEVDPFFFVTDRVQKRLAFNNGVPVMEPLDWTKFKHECNTSVTVYDDAESDLDVSLPDDVTSHLYGSPEGYGLPLQRLLRHPAHPRSGKLSIKEGYDPTTENYSDLRGEKIGHIPEVPGERLVRWAVKVFTEHLLVDYPFSDGFSTELVDKDGNPVIDTGAGSRAHALAMLLDPFVAGLVDGPTPLYAIDKPKRGTGATKLAKCAHIVSNGAEVEPTPLPDDEREVRVTLMGLLMAAVPDVFFDNVEAYFEYAAMLAYATGTGLSGRVLGKQDFVSLTRRNRTILTGNRLSPGEQMTRRILPIYLNARSARPELRGGFKYPDLEAMVLARRRIFVRAALIIVQNWFAKGQPKSDVKFGGYESYAAIMGGVLHAAGVTGFLSNREVFYDAKRTEIADVTDFIWALHSGLTDKEKQNGFGSGYADSIAYADGALQYGCIKIENAFGDKARKTALANYITQHLLDTYTLTDPETGKQITVELVKGKPDKAGARWRFVNVEDEAE